eukprot:scaffold80096_cov17-Tisochrysis_lutea.AAC.1
MRMTHVHSMRAHRFRAVHEEVCKLDQDFGATFSGVLTDDAGHVRALWGSYAEQVRLIWCGSYAWLEFSRRMQAICALLWCLSAYVGERAQADAFTSP